MSYDEYNSGFCALTQDLILSLPRAGALCVAPDFLR
jgi:hypothetical protein